MKTILFQGDSITDSFRSREGDTYMGCGYPAIVAADLSFKYPKEFTFINRGVSGDRCRGVLNRMRNDIYDVKPDVLSILVGINDVWKEFAEPGGVDGNIYLGIYDILIKEIKSKFPDSKLMIIEPFTSPACMPDKEHWDLFKKGYDIVREKTKEIAKKHNAVFVPTMDEMTNLINKYGSECYLLDGTHPTQAGHRLIANAWLKAFESIKNTL